MKVCVKCGAVQRFLPPVCDAAGCPAMVWYRRAAESEGDQPIGAGVPDVGFEAQMTVARKIMKQRRKALRDLADS